MEDSQTPVKEEYLLFGGNGKFFYFISVLLEGRRGRTEGSDHKVVDFSNKNLQ